MDVEEGVRVGIRVNGLVRARVLSVLVSGSANRAMGCIAHQRFSLGLQD